MVSGNSLSPETHSYREFSFKLFKIGSASNNDFAVTLLFYLSKSLIVPSVFLSSQKMLFDTSADKTQFMFKDIKRPPEENRTKSRKS